MRVLAASLHFLKSCFRPYFFRSFSFRSASLNNFIRGSKLKQSSTTFRNLAVSSLFLFARSALFFFSCQRLLSRLSPSSGGSLSRYSKLRHESKVNQKL